MSQLLQQMTKKTSDCKVCVLQLAPVPASRPKVGRWGVYYGKTYARWKQAADKLLSEKNYSITDKPLVVQVEQICKRPKTTKRIYPNGDVDNHAKGPLDAITRSDFGWHDDSQIVELKVSKRFAEDGEEPRSIVRWKVALSS